MTGTLELATRLESIDTQMTERPKTTPPAQMASWQEQLYQELLEADVRQVAYVPDAGHRLLIERCLGNAKIKAVALTTEEEGVAMLAGAWLGGERGVLLMQSSGAGNCINMLSLNAECRMPLLMLVTMRGEWGEFNSWQLPMGQATEAALRAAGVLVYRAEHAAEVAETVRACAALAFNSARAVAVLIGQRVIGAKAFKAAPQPGRVA